MPIKTRRRNRSGSKKRGGSKKRTMRKGGSLTKGGSNWRDQVNNSIPSGGSKKMSGGLGNKCLDPVNGWYPC